jgi:hypothetical protein
MLTERLRRKLPSNCRRKVVDICRHLEVDAQRVEMGVPAIVA